MPKITDSSRLQSSLNSLLLADRLEDLTGPSGARFLPKRQKTHSSIVSSVTSPALPIQDGSAVGVIEDGITPSQIPSGGLISSSEELVGPVVSAGVVSGATSTVVVSRASSLPPMASVASVTPMSYFYNSRAASRATSRVSSPTKLSGTFASPSVRIMAGSSTSQAHAQLSSQLQSQPAPQSQSRSITNLFQLSSAQMPPSRSPSHTLGLGFGQPQASHGTTLAKTATSPHPFLAALLSSQASSPIGFRKNIPSTSTTSTLPNHANLRILNGFPESNEVDSLKSATISVTGTTSSGILNVLSQNMLRSTSPSLRPLRAPTRGQKTYYPISGTSNPGTPSMLGSFSSPVISKSSFVEEKLANLGTHTNGSFQGSTPSLTALFPLSVSQSSNQETSNKTEKENHIIGDVNTISMSTHRDTDVATNKSVTNIPTIAKNGGLVTPDDDFVVPCVTRTTTTAEHYEVESSEKCENNEG